MPHFGSLSAPSHRWGKGDREYQNDGNGWISYDSLVLIVEHRFGDLNLETSYVRSKNLNNDSGMQIFGSTTVFRRIRIP